MMIFKTLQGVTVRDSEGAHWSAAASEWLSAGTSPNAPKSVRHSVPHAYIQVRRKYKDLTYPWHARSASRSPTPSRCGQKPPSPLCGQRSGSHWKVSISGRWCCFESSPPAGGWTLGCRSVIVFPVSMILVRMIWKLDRQVRHDLEDLSLPCDSNSSCKLGSPVSLL